MFYALQTTWQLLLLLIGLAIFAVVCWRWPKLGAWLVIFLAPLYVLKIAPWPLTVSEAMIWVFVLAWLVKGGMTKDKITAITKNELFWPILLVLLGVFISTIFSSDLKIGFGILKAWFIAPLIFAAVLNDILDDGGGVKLVLAALAASAASAALLAGAYLLGGRLTFDGRLAAWYLSPNHLAMWLVPGLIASLGLWFKAKKTYQRILLLAISSWLLAILYFTHSSGAWLGLIAAAVLILFYFWRLKLISQRQLLIVNCCLLILFAVVFFLQLGGGNNEKLTDLLVSPRSSWQSRLMIWQSAMLILKDHWLLGVGPGLFQEYYLAYQQYWPAPYLEWAVPQPHNLLLAWWLQAGLAGLVGFLWLVVIFFRRGFEALKEKKTRDPFFPAEFPTPTISPPQREGERKRGWLLAPETKPPLSIVLMAVMIYFLAHGLVDTTFWKNDLALIFWLTVFLGSTAGHRGD